MSLPPPDQLTAHTSLRGQGDISQDSSFFNFQNESQQLHANNVEYTEEESSASEYMTAFSRSRSRPNRSASRRKYT